MFVCVAKWNKQTNEQVDNKTVHFLRRYSGAFVMTSVNGYWDFLMLSGKEDNRLVRYHNPSTFTKFFGTLKNWPTHRS